MILISAQQDENTRVELALDEDTLIMRRMRPMVGGGWYPREAIALKLSPSELEVFQEMSCPLS